MKEVNENWDMSDGPFAVRRWGDMKSSQTEVPFGTLYPTWEGWGGGNRIQK